MAHFGLENALSEAPRNENVGVHKGPLLKWQHRALESGVRAVANDCK